MMTSAWGLAAGVVLMVVLEITLMMAMASGNPND